jgi:hypothetical protein
MNELAFSAETAQERLDMLNNGEINSQAYLQASTAAINEEKWEGLDPTEIENYADHLRKVAQESDLLDDSLGNTAEGLEAAKEAAEDVALYTIKMNKGIKKLADGFDEWQDVLTKSDKSS